MTKAVLYARYSTDMQSAASAEDQLRLLRQRAGREGWIITGEHADRAISGTVRNRAGLNACLAAIEAGEATVLLAEALDRISRDQEDIAGIFKRVRFGGARIVTLSEGEVGAIHIGMGGTISALFLEQLAEKTRRGQIGRVAAGRIPGGLSYGYRAVRSVLDARGEPERGLREIDEAQADVVRRIFRDYARGISPRTIAHALNAEHVLAPRGGLWRANAILGHRARRNGVLHNELYRGRILFNRQSFRKDPDTRRRISRANPESDLVEVEVPALRIVDEDLWSAVQTKLAKFGAMPAHAARRPRRLLSGLLRCGGCGGSYTIVSADRWGCATRAQSGACSNGATIANTVLEERVWTSLKAHALHPEVVAAYFDELVKAMTEARREALAGRGEHTRRLAKIAQEEERIVDAIVVTGMPAARYKARAEALAAERRKIEADLALLPTIDEVTLHPAMAESYRRRAGQLQTLLQGDPGKQEDARQFIAELVDHIEIAPKADGSRGVDLIVMGDLSKLLARPEGRVTAKMVAGVGFGRWSKLAWAA